MATTAVTLQRIERQQQVAGGVLELELEQRLARVIQLIDDLQDGRHLPASDVMLSDVPPEDRCKLQPCQLTRCEAVRAVGYLADSIGRDRHRARGDRRRGTIGCQA
jgi:hypothetical protein